VYSYLIVFLVGGSVFTVAWLLLGKTLGSPSTNIESENPKDDKLDKTTPPTATDSPKDGVAKNNSEEERLRVERELLAIDYTPSINFIYQSPRVLILNNGRTNVELWGASYGAIDTPIEREPRLITPGTHYYIQADQLESQMRARLTEGQQGFTPCRVFVKTQDKKKYTIKGQLLGEVKNGVLSIHTQTIGAVEGWHEATKQTTPPLPTPDIKKQTREELANLLRQYHLIISECTNVGPGGSGAAHTPEDCEAKKNDWQTKTLAAVQHRLDIGALDNADVVSIGWAHSPPEVAEALKELIAQLR